MAETDKKELKKLPPATLTLIVGMFILILVFISGILFPQYLTIKKVKEERISKTILLEKQKRLLPVYAKALALSNIKFDPLLPVPDRKALERNNISSLSKRIKRIAMKHNMVLSQNNLDIGYLKNKSNMLSMDLLFTGNLFDFRDCLISLARIPFFKRYETIKILTDQSNTKRFFVKILITIDKK